MCSICDLDTRVNLKKNQNILLSRSLRGQTQFLSYKFSVLKFAFTASKCTRMHHFEAIFQKFPGGDPPVPPPAGGGDPLPHPPPFGASRLSEAFGFRPWCSSSFLSCSREKKVGHPWCLDAYFTHTWPFFFLNIWNSLMDIRISRELNKLHGISLWNVWNRLFSFFRKTCPNPLKFVCIFSACKVKTSDDDSFIFSSFVGRVSKFIEYVYSLWTVHTSFDDGSAQIRWNWFWSGCLMFRISSDHVSKGSPINYYTWPRTFSIGLLVRGHIAARKIRVALLDTRSEWQCIPIIFMTHRHRSFSVILSSNIRNLS